MNPNPRILITDDNPAIHEDFRKILCPKIPKSEVDDLEASLFGSRLATPETSTFEMDSAYQGQEALSKVQQAVAEKHPYAMAFVDGRMPPGWDGVETIEQLWKTDPYLQVVICTAYADYSWDEIVKRLGQSDGLVILKKPFDEIEVLQLTHALTKKWTANLQARSSRESLAVLRQEAQPSLEEVLRETDLLLDTLLTNPQRKHAQSIKAASERLRNILSVPGQSP